jgi:hypothetical protein
MAATGRRKAGGAKKALDQDMVLGLIGGEPLNHESP